MYDEELIYSSLKQIRSAIELIIERSESISDVNDFLTDEGIVRPIDAVISDDFPGYALASTP